MPQSVQLEEIRGFVLQALREGQWNQFGTLVQTVGQIKARVYKLTSPQPYGYGDGRQYLNDDERSLLLEVVWGLIIQGILIPGLNESNPGWPFLSLTQYGRSCVAANQILPHDPDGFLRDFRRDVPNCDSTIVEYLTEALQCYVHGLYRSAAVMLGVASEKAVLLLIDAFGNSLGDAQAKQNFNLSAQKAQSIYRKYELFEKRFPAAKPQMPATLSDNVDSLLRGIFDLIRESRNEAGHPAGGHVTDRDIVYSHLRLFKPYCKRITELIDWFATNSTQPNLAGKEES